MIQCWGDPGAPVAKRRGLSRKEREPNPPYQWLQLDLVWLSAKQFY